MKTTPLNLEDLAKLFRSILLIFLLILLPRLAVTSIPPMPGWFLLTLLAFPKTWRLWQLARRWPESAKTVSFQTLDGATAQLNLIFGLLSIIAILLHGLC